MAYRQRDTGETVVLGARAAAKTQNIDIRLCSLFLLRRIDDVCEKKKNTREDFF